MPRRKLQITDVHSNCRQHRVCVVYDHGQKTAAIVMGFGQLYSGFYTKLSCMLKRTIYRSLDRFWTGFGQVLDKGSRYLPGPWREPSRPTQVHFSRIVLVSERSRSIRGQNTLSSQAEQGFVQAFGVIFVHSCTLAASPGYGFDRI